MRYRIFCLVLFFCFTACSKTVEHRKEVAGNPSTDPQLLNELADDEIYYVKRMVAANPSALPETLVKLSRDEDVYIKNEVARNPNTPAEAFSYIVNNYNPYSYDNRNYCDLALTIIENHNCNSIALSKLYSLFQRGERQIDFSYKYYLKMMGILLQHPNLPPHIAKELSQSENPELRLLVAQSPQTSTPILVKLAQDPNEFVQKAAQKNSNFFGTTP